MSSDDHLFAKRTGGEGKCCIIVIFSNFLASFVHFAALLGPK